MTQNSSERFTIVIDIDGEIVGTAGFNYLSDSQKDNIRSIVENSTSVIASLDDTASTILTDSNGNLFSGSKIVSKTFAYIDVPFKYIDDLEDYRSLNSNHDQVWSDEIGAVANVAVDKYVSGSLATQAALGVVAVSTLPATATLGLALGAAVVVGYLSSSALEGLGIKDDILTISNHFYGEADISGSIVRYQDEQLKTTFNYTPDPDLVLSQEESQQKALDFLNNASGGQILNQTPIPDKIVINSSSNESSTETSFNVNKSTVLDELAVSLGIDKSVLEENNSYLFEEGGISSDGNYILTYPENSLTISGASISQDLIINNGNDNSKYIVNSNDGSVKYVDENGNWVSSNLDDADFTIKVDFNASVREVFGVGGGDEAVNKDLFSLTVSTDLYSGLQESQDTTQVGNAVGGYDWKGVTTLQILNQDGLENVMMAGIITDSENPLRNTISSSETFASDYGILVSNFNKLILNNSQTQQDIFTNSTTLHVDLSNLTNGAINARSLLNIDPLVLDLDGDGVRLISYDDSQVIFDVDNDGMEERTGWVSGSDGILVHDKNADGIINNITETISEYYNPEDGSIADEEEKYSIDGLDALKKLDSNGDNIFNSQDESWSDLKVWQDANEDGVTDEGELKTLSQAGILEIDLNREEAYKERDEGNVILSRSTYTTINGEEREVAAVDFTTNPMGYEFNDVNLGKLATAEDGTQSLVISNEEGSVVVASEEMVQNIFGNIGDDDITGDENNNWISGGAGSDILRGGAGEDVIIIDGEDLQENIDGGEGRDVVIINSDIGVTFNLSESNVETVVGGNGDDVIIGGGFSNVFVDGGNGDDIIIGGASDDALSGSDGNDYIDGGYGNDMLRGHRGEDTLFGGEGDDYLDGGLSDDKLFGGAGKEILIGGKGSDEIDGGEGYDLAKYSGSYVDYKISRDGGNYTVEDLNNGDIDSLTNIEGVRFDDVTMELSSENISPLSVSDSVILDDNNTIFISKEQLLENDMDVDGDDIEILSVQNAVGGTINIVQSGDVIDGIEFTPDEDYYGLMHFDYSIKDSNGAFTNVIQYNNDGTSEVAAMRSRVELKFADDPSDPLYAQQWYLSEINIKKVWDDYTGDGVSVGVFESGDINITHDDLNDNITDEYKLDQEFREVEQFSQHATTVAGVIAAERNDYGIVGVAYDSDLSGYSWDADEFGVDNFKYVDVANNSWAASGKFDDNFSDLNNPYLEYKDYIEDAVKEGRDGLGTVTVFGGGNGREEGDNVNYHSIQNSRFVIATGSINQPGDLGTLTQASTPFSNPGAAILVSAPGSNIQSTGNLLENENGSTFLGEFSSSQGTSFSAPIISGIAALMLEANASLGYRDVQTILALSARQFEDENTIWQENGSENWNGGGMHFSHDYGYGIIDALAAVRIAETWNEVNNFENEQEHIVEGAGGFINDGSTLVRYLGVLDSGMKNIETVEVQVDIEHENIADLQIKLISPSGAESFLMLNPQDSSYSGSLVFNFSSRQFLGEGVDGEWKLEITDVENGVGGRLKDFNVKFYGKLDDGKDDLYIYTNEFEGGLKSVLRDDDGIDTINAAAVTGDSIINLNAGETSVIANRDMAISGTGYSEEYYAKEAELPIKQDELVQKEAELALQQDELQQIELEYDGIDAAISQAENYYQQKAEESNTAVDEFNEQAAWFNEYIYNISLYGVHVYVSNISGAQVHLSTSERDQKINNYNNALSVANQEIVEAKASYDEYVVLFDRREDLPAEIDVLEEEVNETIDELNSLQSEVDFIESYIESFDANHVSIIENAYSGDGDDVLIGNDVDNELFAGRGENILTGNGGNDTFIIKKDSTTQDTITDFTIGEDKLDLSDLGVRSFDELTINQDGLNAVISFESGQVIILENIVVDDLSSEILLNKAPKISNVDWDLNEDELITLSISELLEKASDLEDGTDIQNITSADIVFGETSNGQLIDNLDGTMTYQPNVDFYGMEEISYQIKDSAGNLSNQATINFDVVSINDTPISSDLDLQIDEDNSINIDVLSNALDIDGDQLVIDNTSNAENGVVSIFVDDQGVQKINYTPNSNYNGSDSFEYTISDGEGGFVTQRVDVLVNAQNDAPIIVTNVANQVIYQNSDFSFLVSGSSFTDIDGDNLSYSASLSEGSNLPEWINFDSDTLEFSGNVPDGQDLSSIVLRILVNDGNNAEVYQDFSLDIASKVVYSSEDSNIFNGSEFSETLVMKGGDIVSGLQGSDLFKLQQEDFTDNIVVTDFDVTDQYEKVDLSDFSMDYSNISISDSEFGAVIDFDIFENSLTLEGILAQDIDFDSFVGLTNTTISMEDQILYASNDGGFLSGGFGNDVLYGSYGDDVLIGRDGDDVLVSTYGDDILKGGSGSDVFKINAYYFSESTHEVQDFEVGADKIDLTGSSSSQGMISDFSELSISQDGDDTVIGFGYNDNSVIILKDVEVDNLSYGDFIGLAEYSSYSTVQGSDGIDDLMASYGHSVITGGLGADTFYMFADKNAAMVITDFNPSEGDQINISSPFDEGKYFDDLDIVQNGSDVEINLGNFKKIIIENYNVSDVVEEDFIGLKRDFEVVGSKFDDLLDYSYYVATSQGSYGGVVTFSAGDGDDDIYATGYDDIIFGGDGNDLISGMSGNDVMFGGEGSDIFEFGSGSSSFYNISNDYDIIEDFNIAEDVIRFDGYNGVSGFSDLEISDGDGGTLITFEGVISSPYGDTQNEFNQIFLRGVEVDNLSESSFIFSQEFSLYNTGIDFEGTLNDDVVYLNDIYGGNDDGLQNTVNTLDGDDYVVVRSGNNIVNLGNGDDYMSLSSTIYDIINGAVSGEYYGGNGNDDFVLIGDVSLEVHGDQGDDSFDVKTSGAKIYGGEGVDEINLGMHELYDYMVDEYTIIGGNNEVYAGLGDDIITIASGGNIIYGNEGVDRFILRDYDNLDEVANVISDFELTEKIDLQSFSDIKNFDDLEIVSDANSNTVINFGEGKAVILEDIEISQISAENFIFRSAGTSDNDVIIDRFGDNIFEGGEGVDLFEITKTSNSNKIIDDFSVGQGEKIRIKDFPEVRSFDDIVINYVLENDSYGYYNSYLESFNAEINLGDGQFLVIKDVEFNSLNENHFEFLSSNEAPVVQNPISLDPIHGGIKSEIDISNIFTDIEGDDLSYEITQLNGDELPWWIKFDQINMTLDVRAPYGNARSLEIVMTAIDHENNNQASHNFTVDTNYNLILGEKGVDNNILGSDDPDKIISHEGDDVIIGGRGDDRIMGGEGADIIDGGDGDKDFALYHRSTEGVNINLETGEVSGGDAAGDSITNIEGVVGSKHDDILVGNDMNNIINGNAGDDNIIGGNGNDVLRGQDGDDIISGGIGLDRLVGGSGADILDGGDGDRDYAIYRHSSEAINIDLEEQVASGGEAEGDVLINIENIIASLNDDVVIGDDSRNILRGLDGDDNLSGREGNDLLIGGLGADILDGGEGRDRAFYNKSLEAVTIDLETNINEGGEAQGDILTSVEDIVGSAYSDTINMNDLLNIIVAGKGDDIIDARGGNDRIYGDAGADVIIGGEGKDRFIYRNLSDSTSESTDIILDFIQGEDKILFKNQMNFSSISQGQDSSTDDTQLEYYLDSQGDTIIQSQDEEFQIKLQGEIYLSDGDFVF